VRTEEIVLLIGMAFIIGGFSLVWMAMQSRRHFREMEHRERLAMIEHGLMPSPERDPAAFERAIVHRTGVLTDRPSRARTAGVMMIALGIAFAFLMGFATREPAIGIGLGGAFAILGAGFFVMASLSSDRHGYVPPTYVSPRAPIRSDQPPPPQ